MGKHTKGHMSLESGFSFVEGPLHPKAMFEGGDPRAEGVQSGLFAMKSLKKSTLRRNQNRSIGLRSGL